MTDSPSIFPSDTKLRQWESLIIDEEENVDVVLLRVFQAGADQELEACCEWFANEGYGTAPDRLRAARRPKPLSLKQQSLALIDLIQGNEKCWDIRDLDVVRRALEALPDN